jgi:quercetin dioxygenase-like cupin family protein
MGYWKEISPSVPSGIDRWQDASVAFAAKPASEVLMKPFHVSLLIVTIALVCAAQSTGPQPKVENVNEMKFVNFPNMPPCFTGSVENGDPSTGPSTFLVKGPKGCSVPMHFHSVTEQVVMVSGTGRVQMKGDQPRVMKAGAFAISPARHPHQFECTSNCEFYVFSDGAFDIHYINDSGKEIPFDVAVKTLKKPTAGSTY